MKMTAEHEAVARALYLADVEPETDNWGEVELSHSGEHYRWLAEVALDAMGIKSAYTPFPGEEILPSWKVSDRDNR